MVQLSHRTSTNGLHLVSLGTLESYARKSCWRDTANKLHVFLEVRYTTKIPKMAVL